ncbi:putative inner membrane protein [Shigella flexneri]|nr:putative inner membrane protein [Shigella flexneri]
MRAIGKLPKGVLILEFIGMMLLAVALLSVSDSLSLPEPFSRPEVQILMIFLGVLLMLPAAVVVILQVAKRLAPQLMNPFPKRSVRRLLTAPVRRPVPVFCSVVALFALPTKHYVKNW